MNTVSINFNANTRTGRGNRHRKHTLPKCAGTGLARFRDRHQARDAAKAFTSGQQGRESSMFACPECRGWHVETRQATTPATEGAVPASVPAVAFTESLSTRKRRYFLVDIENPTRGAKATCEEVATFWDILKGQAPGIAPHDHVVVGASRGVAERYRTTITGANVRWVTGANAPDGADRALLGAVDLHQVARHYDELVIVSGDHAFADLAHRAKAFGLSVQVVTAETPERRSMLSRELAAAADVHTLVRLKVRPKRRENLRRLNLLKASLAGSTSTAAVAA
ncbi:NYN domain-containing protein [Nocardioides sambongensis]|uniref:NYN domain-containing protein n=1 Tax=Nocardioides sambongensis TaxID=2589074 RepID=UPI0011297B9F|nr:NYN domain-containing protein [Nocardioides sambongensis]